jgi:putative tryptophan/tyrosine transport system substrate-binding protein
VKRREFITVLGGAAVAWPLAASAQQPALPIVSFVEGRSAEATVRQAAAFRKALNEAGYVEGQNVMLSTTGWMANTIACRRSWPISCAVAWL